jgi:hypothetical protein
MKKDQADNVASPLMGTERVFFESQREQLRMGYEASVQKLVDAWESSSVTISVLARKRFREVRFITFFGTLVLRCREGIGENGRWTCPALAYLGLRPNQRYSPDMERRMAVLATQTLSYEKAASVGEEAAWLSFSDNAVRATVMRLGAVDEAAPPQGACAGAAGAQDTLIIMADGWNARHRGENWGNDKENRNLPDRVHWYEIRSALIFKLSALLAVSGNRTAIMEKHVVAVPAETSSYDFGVLLHREAMRMGLAKAKNVFFVMDGGVWLWNIYKDRFQKCSKAMLDFYHLSQHLHDLGAALHGAGTEQAKAWCSKILHELKHNSPEYLLKTLDELLAQQPCENPTAAETIRIQNAYVRGHAEHMDYAANSAMGVPIGSGSVESLCSQFQNRLKRTGQFWSKDGFSALIRLVVRQWNRELDSLWMASAA